MLSVWRLGRRLSLFGLVRRLSLSGLVALVRRKCDFPCGDGSCRAITISSRVLCVLSCVLFDEHALPFPAVVGRYPCFALATRAPRVRSRFCNFLLLTLVEQAALCQGDEPRCEPGQYHIGTGINVTAPPCFKCDLLLCTGRSCLLPSWISNDASLTTFRYTSAQWLPN